MCVFNITKAPIGFNLLLGTDTLDDLGFKLYDEPNNLVIPFEKAKSERKDFLTVVFRTTLEPQSSKMMEFNDDPKFEGSKIMTSPILSKLRLESSVGVVENGKVVAPVMILSHAKISLEPNDKIGKVEKIEQIMDVEDIFISALLPVSEMKLGTNVIRQECTTERKLCEAEIGTLPSEDSEVLQHVIAKYGQIFANCDRELTQTDLVEHSIDTGEAAPIRSKMRPVPYAYRERVAEMVHDYLGRGLIRPSCSPWASPIVIVPKKDGTLRFCVDYKGINSVTRKDSFPLPNIDNTLLMLGGKKFFTTLDFMSGYWQIRMEENSVEKTAFVTEFGLHEFNVMPFGLSNAVATFQRFMSKLFEGILNDYVFVYIDDILIASDSFPNHLKHIESVFQLINEAGLKLKVSKCRFCLALSRR